MLAWPGLAFGGLYVWRAPDGSLHFADYPKHAGYRPYAGGGRRTPSEEIWNRRALRRLARRLAVRHGVDPDLVEAVVAVESDYDPFAISAKGAMGLMQLMPATARRLGVRNPFDPHENLEGGIRLLKALLLRYRGRVELALAAYHAGAGAVSRHGGIPPYPSTRAYVRRILTLWEKR